MLADYHTHTPLCRHAEGNPVEYARHAQSIGLAEIGFSDHNPMPEFFDDWRMLITDLPRYVELVTEAREALPGFPIRLALECDYLEGREKWIEKTATLGEWDYLIGSVHYIHDGIAVDDPQHMARWTTATDIEHMWSVYWKLYEKMIRTGLFDFYAHPDLAKKFGFRPAVDLRRYYEPVVQALLDTHAVMEVSTAGLRKEVAEIYPAREMLEMAYSAKVPIVISSDAHQPVDVGADFDQALKLVRSVGYTTTVRFEKRQRREVLLPESWPSA
jgi:histidinol-phosphatase (PHP family)